jgi:hypothetical protein
MGASTSSNRQYVEGRIKVRDQFVKDNIEQYKKAAPNISDSLLKKKLYSEAFEEDRKPYNNRYLVFNKWKDIQTNVRNTTGNTYISEEKDYRGFDKGHPSYGK